MGISKYRYSNYGKRVFKQYKYGRSRDNEHLNKPDFMASTYAMWNEPINLGAKPIVVSKSTYVRLSDLIKDSTD